MAEVKPEYQGPCPDCGEVGGALPLSTGRTPVFQCNRCGAVFRVPASQVHPERTAVRTVVSRGDTSSVCTINCQADEEIRVGDHRIALCGDEAIAVEVTSIECGESRKSRSPVSAVTTLWSRMIEEVDVHFSVHDGWKTIPFTVRCSGEETFSVGEVKAAGGKRVRIRQIKLRDGPLLRKDGWRSVAHRITRIYGNFER